MAEREVWREFDAWEADLCPGCGQPLTETTKKLGKNEAARYAVDVRFCQACKQVELKAEADRESDERRSKQAGRRLPSGHRRYSVHPVHAAHPGEAAT